MIFLSCGAFSQTPSAWDVRNFGARGDGTVLDTKAIQAAIDSCHRSGGGEVCLRGGVFLSGTVYLKSHVSLCIQAGATLLGSNRQQDYPVTASKYPSYHGAYITNRMLIYAEDAEHISVEGAGTVDGRGNDFENINQLDPLTQRPRIIHLRGCRNVKIHHITLKNAAAWVQDYYACEDLLIDGVTVDSRENPHIERARFADAPGRNTDGLDIVDCRNVRITNCFINSGDDGICLKSLTQQGGCRNIAITNCMVTTNASGIKIGTETAGGFEDITVSNCTLYDLRLGGIDIMCVDGARVERILVSNITLRNVKGTAIFIRLGNRGRLYRKDETSRTGSIRNIVLQNIYGTDIERYGCSITGMPDAPVENITLENISLTFRGGSRPLLFQGEEGRPVRELTVDDVPEAAEKHPRGDMFGKLPAYGFYVRHVYGIRFNGIYLDTKEEDIRPAIVFDDVTRSTIRGLSAGMSPVAVATLYFHNVRQAMVEHSSAASPTPVFLRIAGDQTGQINLGWNDLRNVRQACVTDNPSLDVQIHSIGK